jgi:hypothetical protein
MQTDSFFKDNHEFLNRINPESNQMENDFFETEKEKPQS